ncbi:hypothetical protein Syun_023082 [Stephania yunnanensis]|uniref:Uncharacterized protein n=1 Tax=Stephania yunnanensis TaxID=152371 RepID=A0AAP0I360_9MAGN
MRKDDREEDSEGRNGKFGFSQENVFSLSGLFPNSRSLTNWKQKFNRFVPSKMGSGWVSSLRGSISSFQEQASCKATVSSIVVPYKPCQSFNLQMSLSSPMKLRSVRDFAIIMADVLSVIPTAVFEESIGQVVREGKNAAREISSFPFSAETSNFDVVSRNFDRSEDFELFMNWIVGFRCAD